MTATWAPVLVPVTLVSALLPVPLLLATPTDDVVTVAFVAERGTVGVVVLTVAGHNSRRL